jgi:hypothetical protein
MVSPALDLEKYLHLSAVAHAYDCPIWQRPRRVADSLCTKDIIDLYLYAGIEVLKGSEPKPRCPLESPRAWRLHNRESVRRHRVVPSQKASTARRRCPQLRRLDRGLSRTGMAGGYLRSEVDDLVLLRGCADTIVVLLPVRPRHARTTCYGRGKRLFHQWPIRLDDDLSARAVPDACTRLGNIARF